jgi:ComF family protein
MTGLKDYILDILFPRRCLGCQILLTSGNNRHVCAACLSGIKIKKDFTCPFCDSPVIEGKTCPFCITSHFLDKLFVVASYDNPLVEKIIKTMKYRFVGSLGKDIAWLMIKYLEQKIFSDLYPDRHSILIAPVPLHRRRLNWRGFNQSEILGRQIAQFFDLPFIADALKRVRDTKPQAEMPNHQSRIANIKNSFEFNLSKYKNPSSLAKGKTFLLIDDVATTASTLDDCARVLKEAEAKEVIGFVFAKGTAAWDKKLLQ